MKDDPDFNIKFVALIEKDPCIYDYSCSDYVKRNVLEKAWETISKEISETGRYQQIYFYDMKSL